MLTGQDYEMFKGSIEASGVFDPIVVQGDALIDGRNRMKACLDLGIEPPVKEYDEEIDVYATSSTRTCGGAISRPISGRL